MKKLISLFASALIITLSSCGIEDPIVTVNSSEDIIVDTAKISELRTDISVGNIEIGYGDTDKAEIHVDYKIQGITQNKVSAVSEHLSCNAEIVDDVFVVSMVDPDSGKSFWEWKNSNAKSVEVSTDIKIILPECFSAFDIKSDVGNIKTNKLKGCFDIKCDVGDLEMNDVSLLSDSDLCVDVGNCLLSLVEVSDNETKISVDVGNITLDTGNLKYVVASGDEEKPVGGKREILVDDKCSIKLECDVGNLEFNQEDSNV